jgi:hypothetical protein
MLLSNPLWIQYPIIKTFMFMKFTVAPVLAGIVLAVLFQACHTLSQEEKIELGESLSEHSFGGLQLYPVRANDVFLRKQKNSGYLTLNEAVSQKKVEITERATNDMSSNHQAASIHEQVAQTSDGAEVNRLFIENKSADTVLILGGEVVEGGNQDRTIAQDVILPPNSGKVDLSVFCVEHGRWNGDSVSFGVAKASLAPAKVRRAALKSADQQMVWDEVAENLEKNNTSSATEALTELKQTADYNKKQEEYRSALLDAFTDDPSVIGVIAVAGGEIVGCELFASHELFAEYYPNLLQSWAGEVTGEAEIMIEPAKVKEYFEKTTMPRVKEELMVKRVPHVSVF